MTDMKNMIKSIFIHAIVGIVIFVVSLLFFNHYVSSEKGQDYSEMSNSTFPVMAVMTESGEYNMMYGYIDPVDLSLVRNQVTVVGEDRKIDLCLHHYNYDITAIQYELFTKSEDNILEEGTLNKLTELEEENINVRKAELVFDTILEKGVNYYLKLAVRLDNDTRIFFYTKIQNGEGNHLKECMDFANTFHKNLFDKTEFLNNITYLEPKAEKKSTSLEKVDIHSKVDAVSFGEMKVKEETEPMITVKEINDVYAVIQMDSILSSEIRDGVIQYYDIEESYKVRYTSDRMYLLDYNRSMSAYYNKALNDPTKNYITLGIQNAENVDILSSDSGYKVCFSQEGQLWYYNYKSSDVAKVFSFSSENLGDVRNSQNNHDIKILKMDDDGNILYIVYGYMNRGHYEGKNGIQLFRYNAEEKCNENIAFFASSIPFSRMKKDVEKLAYLNSENQFYCLLDGDLHKVDIVTGEDEIINSGLVNENITASKSQCIIAVEESKDLITNQCIRMYDLEMGKEQTFACPDKERIRAVGFLADDFIYGTASSQNVMRSQGDTIIFPMNRLTIVNMDGQELKSYSKANRYILDTEVNGSVLEMKFGKKSNNRIISTNDKDYVRFKEEEKSGEVSLVYDYSNVYWNQLSIKFPNYVYIQIEPDLVMTKVLSSEDRKIIALERSNESKIQYYVYEKGEEQSICDNLMEAVNKATEIRGSVISSREEILWECGFADYAMVAGMDQVTKVKSDGRSLAACLQMIAKVNGKKIETKDIDTNSKKVTTLVEEYSGHTAYNLSGCHLDDVLYYISKGSPVLAKLSASRFIIIMSYNSSKVRYLDPVTGKSTAVDRSGLKATLEKAGNKFYTYLGE